MSCSSALAACGGQQAASGPVTAGPEAAAAVTGATAATGAREAKGIAGALLKERAWDYAGAEADYQAVGTAEPHNVEAALGLARVQLLQGKADTAEQTLQAARKSAGEKPDLLNALSSVARAQKRYPLALELGKRVLLRDPQNTQAHAHIAMAYLEQGKVDLAETYLQNVVARLAQLPLQKVAGLYVTLGLVQLKRGHAAQGMAYFHRATELDPGNAAAHVNAGFLALAYRDYAAAKTQLDAAVQLGQATKDVLSARCDALYGARAAEPAASCYAELAQRPGLSDAELAGLFYNLGAVHQTLTRKAKPALDAYRRYVELKGAGLPKTDKVFSVIKKLEAQASEEAAQSVRSPG